MVFFASRDTVQDVVACGHSRLPVHMPEDRRQIIGVRPAVPSHPLCSARRIGVIRCSRGKIVLFEMLVRWSLANLRWCL